MCDTCGCGDPEIVSVEVQQDILAGNDRRARHNRAHFREQGVTALNLMGSPGSGKTALLEASAKRLSGCRLGALSGDLATDRDAERLRAAGIPSLSITTGSACHGTRGSSTRRCAGSTGRSSTCSSSRTSATWCARRSTTSARP